MLATDAAPLHDLDLAIEEHEHLVRKVALAEDHLSGERRELLQRASEMREHVARERAEEAELRELVDRDGG
jgi:hypothetical protein